MPDPDVELVERAMHRWIALIDARDPSALPGYAKEFYADDAWIDFGTRTPEAVPGPPEIMIRWGRDLLARIGQTGAADFRYEIVGEIVGHPGGVIVPARTCARMHGMDLETRFVYHFRVGGGKIVAMSIYDRLDDALAAAEAAAASGP